MPRSAHARPANTTCRAPARPPPTAAVKFEPVFPNVQLSRVVALAQPPGDRSRWFGAVREGTIVSFPVADPPAQPNVVVDFAAAAGTPVITSLPNAYGEGGLLGMAFHPRFATNGRLYVTFTTQGPSGPASEVGYLTTKDGGASFPSYTQDPSLRAGEVRALRRRDRVRKRRLPLPRLRRRRRRLTRPEEGPLLREGSSGWTVDDVATGQTYAIPDGNPFKNGGGEPATFAWGLRNPFRLSVDSATGDVWVGNVGQDSWEEVDRVALGSNQGWPCREGKHDTNTNAFLCPSKEGLVDPIWEHQHGPASPTWRAVTGGIVYRGTAMPGFQGTYVYADYMLKEIWALTIDAAGTPNSVIINDGGPHIAFTDFAEDADGEIYVSSLEAPQIYKLVPATPGAASSLPDGIEDRVRRSLRSDEARARSHSVRRELAALERRRRQGAHVRGAGRKDDHRVGADGDFDLPVGSVVMKSFAIAGRRMETRLFVHHDDGDWAGYAYEWTDDQTDALPPPVREDEGHRRSDLDVSEPERLHDVPLGRGRPHARPRDRAAQPRHHVRGTNRSRISSRRSITSGCSRLRSAHRRPPSWPTRRLRPTGRSTPAPAPTSTRTAAIAIVRTAARAGPRWTSDSRRLSSTPRRAPSPRWSTTSASLGREIIAPGKPETSILSQRVHATSSRRMPPLATRRVDAVGTALLDDWIRGLACP